jgi:hypothetical protein
LQVQLDAAVPHEVGVEVAADDLAVVFKLLEGGEVSGACCKPSPSYLFGNLLVQRALLVAGDVLAGLVQRAKVLGPSFGVFAEHQRHERVELR